MFEENELYKKWQDTDEKDRGQVEGPLSNALSKHAQAVVSEKLRESDPDLVQDVVVAVFQHLDRFRGHSQFTTWVHSIAQNKITDSVRRRVRRRQVFDDRKVVSDAPPLSGEADVVCPTERPDDPDSRIAFTALLDGLSQESALLLSSKAEGFTSGEIGMKLGISAEAVDSRWARLKPVAKKKLT
jgi:RNA polymerase sigma-70 factor (ECF subfamily)